MGKLIKGEFNHSRRPDRLIFSHFSLGLGEGAYKIYLSKDGLYCEHTPMYWEGLKTQKYRFDVTEQQWTRFFTRLQDLNVWSWQPKYENLDIIDGAGWSLNLKVGSREIKSAGVNAYPDGLDTIAFGRLISGLASHSFKLFLDTLFNLMNGLNPNNSDFQKLAKEFFVEEYEIEEEEPEPISKDDKSVILLVNKVISDTYKKEATEIRIQNFSGKKIGLITFRTEEGWKELAKMPYTFKVPVISRIKFMADMELDTYAEQKDGCIDFNKFSDLDIQIQVSIVPNSEGMEDGFLKILGNNSVG